MCNSTTFSFRHRQISLSGILRHFRPPSRHLLLNTHDTNMEFLQLSGPLLDIFLFFSKTKIFHSHPCIYTHKTSDLVLHHSWMLQCRSVCWLLIRPCWCISGTALQRQIIACTATLRQKLQIKLTISSSHIIVYSDAGPTSLITDPMVPGVSGQGSH